MENFDLKKYLAEGKLIKEDEVETNSKRQAIDYLKFELGVYLEGDMEGEGDGMFTLDKDEHGDPELYDETEKFDNAVEELRLGDIVFIQEYGYEGTASLRGEDIQIKFTETAETVEEDRMGNVDLFVESSLEDLEQVVRNLAHTADMSEEEAAEMAIKHIQDTFETLN